MLPAHLLVDDRATPEDLLTLTEADFQKLVVKLARDLGWKVTFWPITKFGGAGRSGFPDLALHREGQNSPAWSKAATPVQETLFLELKTEKKGSKPSAEQLEWLKMLNIGPRQRAYLVRPRDLPLLSRQILPAPCDRCQGPDLPEFLPDPEQPVRSKKKTKTAASELPAEPQRRRKAAATQESPGNGNQPAQQLGIRVRKPKPATRKQRVTQ